MQKVFICGPLRHINVEVVAKQCAEAKRVALRYWRMGYNVYCPHANSGVFHGMVPDDTFLTAALNELASSNIVVMLQGWKKSLGSRIEHALAKKLKKEIWYEPKPTT